MEGAICQKGARVQAGWKLLPCHCFNPLSTCLPLPSAYALPTNTLFSCTFPFLNIAVPLYVVFFKSSSHNMVDFPFGQGSATFQRWACQAQTPLGERRVAHWYEAGREHLEGSHAQKPPPPPHSSNKSFSGVTTWGTMQIPRGKVQLHGH